MMGAISAPFRSTLGPFISVHAPLLLTHFRQYINKLILPCKDFQNLLSFTSKKIAVLGPNG